MVNEERKELKAVDYGANLSLDEARERLAEVEEVINAVSTKYAIQAGSKQKPSTVMAKEDNALLSSCLGVLLPLQLQPSVQAEFKSTNPDQQEGTILVRSTILMQESLLEAARFSNTGVTALYPESPFREVPRRSAPTKLIQAHNGGGFLDRVLRRIKK